MFYLFNFVVVSYISCFVEGRLPSRDRIVQYRLKGGNYKKYLDNGRPIEGPKYYNRATRGDELGSQRQQRKQVVSKKMDDVFGEERGLQVNAVHETTSRQTSSSSKYASSCCKTYSNYSASDLCELYGNNCGNGNNAEQADENDEEQCYQEGLSFIGVSFSVNTKYGNPYSYQLCDQFPMENLIDRSYDYVMSMDEDGWLVGGGYKQFDTSGKMPYVDSAHTELLRIGSLDSSKGGTSLSQVYSALSSTTFEPFLFYPEMVKTGGGKNNNNNGGSSTTPSYDITLALSVVEVYQDSSNNDGGGSSYSTYETFLYNLFLAIDNVNAGNCVDDEDTDPHVTMARGVKFKSSYSKAQYLYKVNLEVAVWQAMYPKGVVIGSSSTAKFSGSSSSRWKSVVGYGNLYFFYNRNNITKSFSPSRSLTSSETYYATLYNNGYARAFYANTTTINFNYQGDDNKNDGNNNGNSWEYNPNEWTTNMALNDPTDGFDLPPNCYEEGETFLGIALSRQSASNLQSTKSFQNQFDFDLLTDRNYTYITGFDSNHGWLVGGESGQSGAGSIVEIDTANIPIFYMGTTNPNMGGMSLSNMIKVLKQIKFGALYIKPAFVFIDSNGHLKLQFEADESSALGYLYNNLCSSLGIKWNQRYPKNDYRLYTSCSMHAAGDRAVYGCGPGSSNARKTFTGGFCPQMTLAYSPKFSSQQAEEAYLTMANNYVDYWRRLYPSGVATGTNKFCSKSGGGCLGLFLNRLDLFYVFSPNLGGGWMEMSSFPPTHSPAPTFEGGCSDKKNSHLARCSHSTSRSSVSRADIASLNWNSFGKLGHVLLLSLAGMVFIVALAFLISFTRERVEKKFAEKAMRKRTLLDQDNNISPTKKPLVEIV